MSVSSYNIIIIHSAKSSTASWKNILKENEFEVFFVLKDELGKSSKDLQEIDPNLILLEDRKSVV